MPSTEHSSIGRHGRSLKGALAALAEFSYQIILMNSLTIAIATAPASCSPVKVHVAQQHMLMPDIDLMCNDLQPAHGLTSLLSCI